MEQIWAKSKRMRTLAEHTDDVHRAFVALFGVADQSTRLSDCWQRFFGFEDFGLFWRTTQAAVIFHDWGKANDGFQNAVLGNGSQVIRHEHLSGLFLGLPTVEAWTMQRTDIDWDAVLGAVISHHLKCGEFDATFEDPFGFGTPHVTSSGKQFTTLWGDLGCNDLWKLTQQLGLSGGRPQLPSSIWRFDGSVLNAFNLKQHATDLTERRLDSILRNLRDKPANSARRRLMWAVRSALIVADAVGSAQPRVGQSIEAWVAMTITNLANCSHDEVWAEIISRRVDQLRAAGRWDQSKGADGWSEFQIECERLPSRALLVAPCGSGKTLAAWRWIARQCDRPVQRVLFLYPTRGTATEGFRDYASWAPSEDAGLIHGTADFELEGMFENPEEEPADPRSSKQFQVDPKLYTLGNWQKRFVSATVDQFLGFMQYQYQSMLMLPLLVNSVVVVDEVHSYDRGMFSALTDLLKWFDVPVLCMTASLPQNRRIRLEERGLHPSGFEGGELERVATALRYRIRWGERSSVVQAIREALERGRKVLWVVNQVSRAQQAVMELATHLDGEDFAVSIDDVTIPLYCYHSRFKLLDRMSRHEKTVAGFRRERSRETRRPVIAITTQVCEMSLDLDADLVVTELAPITSLVQRMGRCNRVPIPRQDDGDILIYRPDANDERPYDRMTLDSAKSFVDRLCEYAAQDPAGKVNQQQLEQTLEQLASDVVLPKRCQFLESGPYADGSRETLRDGEEFSVPGVLARDIDTYLRLKAKRQFVDGLILPVPRKYAVFDDNSRLPKFLCVAPNENYHNLLGFCDQPLTDTFSLNGP